MIDVQHTLFTGDVRNDFYVTLSSGEYRRGNKTADKNVEVTMWVCSERSGETLSDVIFEGAGGVSQSCFKSVLLYFMLWFSNIFLNKYSILYNLTEFRH